MWTVLPTALLLVAFSGEVAGDTTRCPSNSRDAGFLYDYSGKCYQFILIEKTWLDARSFCHSRGGSLASAKSSSKHQWLVGVLVNRLADHYDKQGFWLGLHDRNNEGHWQWDEGPGKSDSSIGWSKWNPGEPNDISGQDCVYMRRSYQWKWVDVGCGDTWHIGRTYSFACEYEMTPPTTTTTTTTPRPTTQPTTTPRTEPTARSTTSSTTAAPTTAIPTTATPTTKNASTDVAPPIPPSPPGSGDLLSDNSGLSGTGAHVGRSSEGEENSSKQAGLTAGIISTLLVIIAILIIIILLKRRRDKRNLPPAHSLANPCYVDTTAGTNNLNREDNPYATCQDMGPGPNANVYVEVGDNPKAEFSSQGKALAFSNQRYMESSLLRAADVESSENAANNSKEKVDKSTLKSTYLDECGPYTDDGYLQQKHIYADVSDITVPAPSIVPNHYDVPEALGSSPQAKDVDVYLYDHPIDVTQRSPSYSNIPAASHYDTPKGGRAVAEEYAQGAEVTVPSVKDSQSANKGAVQYDVPKYRLSDYVDTDAVYSV